MEGFGVGVGVEKCPGMWEEKPEEVFFRQKEKYLEVTLPDIKGSFTFGFLWSFPDGSREHPVPPFFPPGIHYTSRALIFLTDHRTAAPRAD